MKGGSATGMVTFPINNDYFWSTDVTGVGFGATPDSNSWYFDTNGTYAIFDNQAVNIFIPPSAWTNVTA